MNGMGQTIGAFFAGVITVTIISVVLSKKSDTASVVKSIGTAATNLLSVATAPTTGNTTMYAQ